MKCVLISDTHALLHTLQIPDGDVLIHCGDFGFTGATKEWKKFLVDFSKFPHKHKLFTFGNHDCSNENLVPMIKQEANDLGITLLVNDMVEIEGKKFYGSPFTPKYGRWFWMRERGEEMAKIWSGIPEKLDVLFTHGPPKDILDLSVHDYEHCGCEELLKAVKDKKPRHHVFGHIHNWGGQRYEEDGTIFLNVATCDEEYKIANPIQVIEI